MKRDAVPLAYLMTGDEELIGSLIGAVQELEDRGHTVIVDNTHLRVFKKSRKARQGSGGDGRTDVAGIKGSA